MISGPSIAILSLILSIRFRKIILRESFETVIPYVGAGSGAVCTRHNDFKSIENSLFGKKVI